MSNANLTKTMLSEQERADRQRQRVQKSLARLQSALTSAGLDWTQSTPDLSDDDETLAFEQYLATFR